MSAEDLRKRKEEDPGSSSMSYPLPLPPPHSSSPSLSFPSQSPPMSYPDHRSPDSPPPPLPIPLLTPITGNSPVSNKGSFPVQLNVYDVYCINRFTHWIGMGIYHTGIQVHEVEYMFCGHTGQASGIVSGEPQRSPGSARLKFRQSILIGHTEMDPGEVLGQMEGLGSVYTGVSYHILTKNCNHFSDHACRVLTGISVPRWVNRIVKIGHLCKCLVAVDELNARARRAAPPGGVVGNVPSNTTPGTVGSATDDVGSAVN